jgi:hypothetical protein
MFNEALGCIKIYEDGEINENLESSMIPSLQKYTNVICKEPKETVWYDKIEKVCFGKEQTFYHNPFEFSFFSDESSFFSNDMWGMKHVEEKFGNVLGKDIEKTDELVTQKNEELSKFKDKTILIVGAGPSTEDCEWDNEEYDYVWSCTKFYLNEKILNNKLGLVSIGGNVDLEDERFLNALEKTGALCGFECGVSPFKDPQSMSDFKEKFKNKVFYFHTRYFSKLGSMARLICLASFLGAKEVKFIGFDGNPVGQNHAFEGRDKVHDEVWRDQKIGNLYRRQMVLLWEYMLQFDTKFVNLGEGHPNNLTTEISRRYLHKHNKGV